MGPFEYLEPNNIEEACGWLTQYEERARLLAGGTDLLIALKERIQTPDYIIDLMGIPGLNPIYSEKEMIKIGSLATLSDIAYSDLIEKKVPVLIETVQQMANPAIRAMATIGGNLCSASPSADMAPPLMGLGAIVKIIGPIGDRILPVEEFFKGPGENALKRGEILVEIQVPLVPPRTGSAYIKMPARTAVGLALVGVAVVVTLDGECDRVGDVKIFLGAVAPTPLRARRAESLMKGRVIEDDLLGQVSRAAVQEARPLADVRGSAEYRREMVKVLTRRAVSRALKTAKERQRTS